MASISRFSDESFDPKEWVNAALRSKDHQQSLEAHASDRVMRLQLAIQEVNKALEETSIQAVQSLPRVLKDIQSVRQEGQLLRDQMQIVKDDIRRVEEETCASMQRLLELDKVKSRMQHATQALHEADRWKTLVADVDDVLASDNVQAMTDRLRDMQHSLSVLQNVANYDERLQFLETLKNRLEALASPRLVAAFNSHSLDTTREYVKIFGDIGRSDQLQKYYTQCHKASLLELWTEVQEEVGDDRGDTSTWLAKFYDEVLALWHAEVTWCSHVFPSPCSLLCSLLTQTLTSLTPPLDECLERAIIAAKQPLPVLIKLRERTLRFAKHLEKSIAAHPGRSQDEVVHLARTIHAPYLEHLLEYGRLESDQLKSELGTIRLDVSGVMDTIRWIGDSISKLFQFADLSVQRCLLFTSGYGVPSLLTAIEEYFALYASRVQSVVKEIRLLCRLDDESQEVPEDYAQLQNGLRLIEACGDMLLRLQNFENQLGVTILAQTEKMKLLVKGRLSPDAVDANGRSIVSFEYYNYLAEVQPSELATFHRLVTRLQAADNNFHKALLPSACSRLRTLNQQAHDFSFDIIFSQIKHRLASVSLHSVWTSSGDRDPDIAGDTPLDFTLSPQDYIQQVTECLLTLPHSLEVLTADLKPSLSLALQCGRLRHAEAANGNDGHEHQAADLWLGAFTRSTMHEYVEMILRIPKLSAHGTRQLLADIRYLFNVIGAFEVSPLKDLEHLEKLLDAPGDSYHSVVTSLDAEERLAGHVANMRGIR